MSSRTPSRLASVAFVAALATVAAAPRASAAPPPILGASFDPAVVFLHIARGTTHGLVNDYLGAAASRGAILDASGGAVGTFVTVHADDFEAIVKVESIVDGRTLSDADHLALPELGLYFITFTPEYSHAYFRIDKGRRDLDASILKRAAKGQLYDQHGRVAGIFAVVAVGETESLGYVAQFERGFFASDVASGRFSGYLDQVVQSSGFANLTIPNLVMVLVAFIFLYLGIAKNQEPLLLVPIGFGILIGNIPLPLSIFNSVSLYMIDPQTHEYAFNTTGNSVLGIIYFGVRSGLFPPLIFLGIGALTDFSALLSNPKSLLLGAAAQIGIFTTFIGALWLGFSPQSAASIGIIGGADGPTAIFTASRLAPALIGPIAIAAYSYMAMVPIIQPPIMKLLTTSEERLIRMKPGRKVSRLEKVAFPIFGLLVTCLVAPGGLPLLGMLFFGNLLKRITLKDIRSQDMTVLGMILNYCTNNSEKNLSLSLLEKELHVSKYYISHLLRNKLKIGFNDYINSIRVSKACELLLQSDKPVTEISDTVGFNTLRTFNRAFLKQVGITPSAYRSIQ